MNSASQILKTLMERAASPVFVGCAMYYVLKYINPSVGYRPPVLPPSVDLKLDTFLERVHVKVEGENNAAIVSARHTGLKCLLDRGHKINDYLTTGEIKTDTLMQNAFPRQYTSAYKHTTHTVFGIEPAGSEEAFYEDCRECKAATEIRYRSKEEMYTAGAPVHSTTISWARCTPKTLF